MTEHDYLLLSAREMLAQNNLALADVQASYVAIYLSMVFAYTTIAYVAGKQLSKAQVFIATLVYMVASVYVVGTIVFMTIGSIEYQRRTEELFVNEPERLAKISSMLWMDTLIWPTLMMASLVFMWHVRRKK
jgi:hypothetical protein